MKLTVLHCFITDRHKNIATSRTADHSAVPQTPGTAFGEDLSNYNCITTIMMV